MLVAANIFQPLITVFAAVIKFFHDNMGISWGWSIVLLTAAVRLVLMPLTVKQFHSMRKLQHLQPEMKAIQQKYKEDKQRQQEETMRFYRENNVNPLGSCLPLVAQLPVFISLFYMLRRNLRTDICAPIQTEYQAKYAAKYMLQHHVSAAAAHAASLGETTACGPVHGAGFLFINDITSSAHGLTLIALLLLYVGTQVMSTLLMSAPTMDRQQRNLMLLMPLAFVIFIIDFPAGLLVYWITTNTWTMVQQYALKKVMGAPALPVLDMAAPTPRHGGGGDGGGGSAVKRVDSGPRPSGPRPSGGGLLRG
ncbi:MAG: YidC/Oxa1 family membrane protein insertase, partial [Solirubrobacteraceae bacterium]